MTCHWFHRRLELPESGWVFLVGMSSPPDAPNNPLPQIPFGLSVDEFEQWLRADPANFAAMDAIVADIASGKRSVPTAEIRYAYRAYFVGL